MEMTADNWRPLTADFYVHWIQSLNMQVSGGEERLRLSALEATRTRMLTLRPTGQSRESTISAHRRHSTSRSTEGTSSFLNHNFQYSQLNTEDLELHA